MKKITQKEIKWKKKIGERYDVETKSRDKKMNLRWKYKEKE